VTHHLRILVRALAVGALVAVAHPAAGQSAYPVKPVRFIVPYAAGSSLDVQARLYAPRLAEGLGQQVFIDNRGGGNTVIGSEALLRAPPDGHTIMIVAATHVIVPRLLAKVPYDPIRDFAPVANLTRNELALVAHPALPVRTLREFIALAKSKPGQLNFGSPGTGTATHLAIELFNITAGIRMQHVPYNGAGPLTIDLLGGHIATSLQAPITIIPHINSGRLRALGITGTARLPALPQVSTFAEGGLPGFAAKVWFGVLAPAATPKAVIDRLQAEFSKFLLLPEFREKLTAQGVEPFFLDPEQFGALIKTDFEMWAQVIKTANIKADN
jgi:tripartite-type tricarboxylate transporter receptor subunit TctC